MRLSVQEFAGTYMKLGEFVELGEFVTWFDKVAYSVAWRFMEIREIWYETSEEP